MTIDIETVTQKVLLKLKKTDLVDLMDVHNIPKPEDMDKYTKAFLVGLILMFQSSVTEETKISNPDELDNIEPNTPENTTAHPASLKDSTGIEYHYTVKQNDIREFEAHEIQIKDGVEIERNLIKKDILPLVKAMLWKRIYANATGRTV